MRNRLWAVLGGGVAGAAFLMMLGTTLEEHVALNSTAQIVVADGATTYVAEAAPGSAATAPEWRCRKIVASGGTTVVTWADGNAKFDNIPGAAGAGLAALNYQ